MKLVPFDLFLIKGLDPHKPHVLFSLRQDLVSQAGLQLDTKLRVESLHMGQFMRCWDQNSWLHACKHSTTQPHFPQSFSQGTLYLFVLLSSLPGQLPRKATRMTLLRMGTILHIESSSFLLFKMSSRALAFPFMSTDVCNYNVCEVRFVSGVWCQGHCIIMWPGKLLASSPSSVPVGQTRVLTGDLILHQLSITSWCLLSADLVCQGICFFFLASRVVEVFSCLYF